MRLAPRTVLRLPLTFSTVLRIADATAVLSVTNVEYAVNGGAASSTPPAGVSLTGASLSVDPTDPSFDSIAQGQVRTITVTYNVTDELGATVPQTATITITGTNDVPVITTAVGGNAGAITESATNLSQPSVAVTSTASGLLSATDVDQAQFSLGTPMLPEL